MPWRILIADDEPKIRRGLAKYVESLGEDFLVVAEAEDGEQALAMACDQRPDLLLVDLRMPFMDGLELIRSLAADAVDRRVVVISGHDESEYTQQALGLGVFDYLLKPVEETSFLEAVRRAVADLERQRTKPGAAKEGLRSGRREGKS